MDARGVVDAQDRRAWIASAYDCRSAKECNGTADIRHLTNTRPDSLVNLEI